MKKLILGLIVVILVVGLAWYTSSVLKPKPETPVGSVNIGGEYQATSTYQITGSGIKAVDTWFAIATTTPSNASSVDLNSDSRKNAVILGSVIVASTTPHALYILNSTSTAASGLNSSSTIAILPANLAAGTYTFDAILDRGLVLKFYAGFSGDYIITYR